MNNWTAEKLLALPEDKLIRVASEKYVPKPWKHDVEEIRRGSIPKPLKKCRKCGQCYPIRHSSCTVPDCIKIDWNTAMEYARQQESIVFEYRMEWVYYALEGERATFSYWYKHKAQPRHYIIAAILAQENKA